MARPRKFSFPDGHWNWYAMEFDGEDIFYGFVEGTFPEFGEFSLSELKEVRGALGLPIERDKFFKPCRWSELESKVRTDPIG